MVAMEDKTRAKEVSFQWPHHAVDLVEQSLEADGASVICLASEESKTFIACKVFQEFWRRNPQARRMALLVGNEKGKVLKIKLLFSL